jgi:hypothetical protein
MKALRRVAAQICIQHILQPRQYMWRLVFQDNWSWAILLSLTVWFIVLQFRKLSEKIALVHTRVKDESTELQRKNLCICRDSWAKTQNLISEETFLATKFLFYQVLLYSLEIWMVYSLTKYLPSNLHTHKHQITWVWRPRIVLEPDRGQLYRARGRAQLKYI